MSNPVTPKFTIKKTVVFDAGHHLNGLEPGHKCGSPHGHTYKVEVVLSSLELNKVGFVVDFGRISDLIKKRYDHKVLNDVLPNDVNPTAENLALDIIRVVLAFLFNSNDEAEVVLEYVSVREGKGGTAIVRLIET